MRRSTSALTPLSNITELDFSLQQFGLTMNESEVPVIDLTPFIQDVEDQHRKKLEVMEKIKNAACQYGFFRLVNHGVPTDLMNQCLDLSAEFFDYPVEEKVQWKQDGRPSQLRLGYTGRMPGVSAHNQREMFVLYAPFSRSEMSHFNVYPARPPQFRNVHEELSFHMMKMAYIVEDILNDCMGLPPGFLREYRDNRSTDHMIGFHYFPKGDENIGVYGHQDPNFITFLLQDNVGGLELLKDGEYIEVTPQEGTIIVNIGDVLQVMTDNKFKSATHRVMSQEKNRYSFALFCDVGNDNWVEPLPQFTEAIGEPPNYKGFYHKDYLEVMRSNRASDPLKLEEPGISYFATPTLMNK